MPERRPDTPSGDALAELLERDLRFREMAENIDALFWLYDVDERRTLFVSPAFERIMGVPEEQLYRRGDLMRELVHPDDLERVSAVQDRIPDGVHELEYRVVRPGGEVRWVRDRRFPIRDASGRIYRVAGIAEDITEREHADQKRRALEQHYRRLVETSPQAIFAIDAEGRITELNQAGGVLLGYEPAELIGRPFSDVFDEPGLEVASTAFARLMSGAEPVVDLEAWIRRKSGEQRLVHVRASAVFRDGQVVGTHGVARDITEERHAQQELELANVRLAQILGASPTILYTLRVRRDGTAEPLWVSENIGAILGYRSSEALDARWWPDNLHPDDAADAFAAFGRVVQRGAVSHEYRFRAADGGWRWVHDELRVFAEQEGELDVVGSWTDITEVQTSRQMLDESEATYQSLFNSLVEMVCIMDPEGMVLDVNNAVLERTGYTRDELVGRQPAFLAELRGEEERELIECYRRAVQGQPQRTQLRALTKTGERFPAELSFVRGRHFGRDVMITVGQDITERVAAEQAMRAAEAHYRRLVENSPYGIYVLDEQGRFAELNDAGLELLGRTYEDVIGRPMSDVILPADLPKAAEALRRRLKGEVEVSELELRVQRPSGESRLLHIRAAPIVEDGVVVGTHGVARDITADRRNEQQLRRAERLATIGTLIGGVAHELNNPLQAITNFASLLLEDAHTDQERDDLETIRREAARAGRIVADLRLLARDTQEVLAERVRVDVNDIVRHVLKTRRYSLGVRNIEVREDLGRDLPPVWADPGDLEQVLINLIVNAEQAMESGPSRLLIVRTRATGIGVAIHVVDSGPGIAREYLDQIFDPFFTTKKRSEGTGLGLSLVHKIISEHGGEIHAESELGRGAAFHIHLPRAAASEPARSAPAAHETPAAARALRILVVDDEPAIRSAVSRYLRRRGHQVDVASEGSEALRILQSTNAVAYDVVLSDLRMPGLGGDQLLAQLRASGNGVERRLIFLTGEAAGGTTARMIAEFAVPVIFKPIELADLAQRVEQFAEEVHQA